MSPVVGPLDPADLDQAFSLNRLSFAATPDRREPWQQSVLASCRTGLAVGAYEDGRLLGMARLKPLRQWWSGRLVPTAGLASVAVLPEARGRGIGAEVVRAAFAAATEAGYPVCGLYPSVEGFYRRLGAEAVGRLSVFRFPASALPRERGRAAPVHPAGPDDAATVAALAARVHAAGDRGAVENDHAVWRRRLTVEAGAAYLVEGPDGTPSGLLCYEQTRRPELEGFDVSVRSALAATAAAHRTVWGLLAGMSPVAVEVSAVLAEDDPVLDVVDAVPVERHRYFARVLDAAALVAARGAPAGLTARVPLRVSDPQRPANDGDWVLTAGAAAARLERAPAGREPLRVGARGLAALLTGAAAVGVLRRAGLAEGGRAEDDRTLGALLGAAPARLLDYF